MPRPRPPRSTVSLPGELRGLLEARGARSDKGRGPLSYTNQLRRTLEFYDAVHVRSDPRETQGMSQADYELVLDVLTDPVAIEVFHVVVLGDYLRELPAFQNEAKMRQRDPETLLKAINAYSYAEKLHLVDAAQARHAPPPPRKTVRRSPR